MKMVDTPVKQQEHAESLIKKYALVCGIVGVFPGSSLILPLIDAKMVLDLQANYDAPIHYIDILIVVVVATIVGHGISDFLLFTVGIATLGLGFLVKGGLAYFITVMAGRYASETFRKRKLDLR
jgi:hypothetical protein